MALLKDIEEIKKHVPINLNMDYETVKPFVDQCELTHIIPAIGQDLYDKLNALYPYSYPMDPADEALLKHIQRALSYYTIGEASPFLSLMVGNIGMQEQSSKDGSSTPARQFVYNNYVKSLFKNGDIFMDNLLKFMEDNKTAYPLWANDSQAYTITKQFFIYSAQELSEYVKIFGSRTTFKAIRPFIDLAERKYIIPATCKALFDSLKSKLLSGYNTAEDDIIINLIKRPLAYLAMVEAIPSLNLEISHEGARIVTFNDGNHSKGSANDNTVIGNIPQGSYLRSMKNNGDAFLSELKKYLEDNADDITLYKESTCYTCIHKNPPGEIPDNDDKVDFWT
jgi:hypothetical protein